MMFPFAALTFSACFLVFGATSAAAIPAGPISATYAADTLRQVVINADSALLLTVDALTRMTIFRTAYMKEPLSVRDTGSWSVHNRERVYLYIVGKTGGQQLTTEVENLVAMATAYPSVAADFKHAGLTPQRWEALRNALWMAEEIMKGVDRGDVIPPMPTSVLGQNIAFLKAHQKEFDALRAVWKDA